MSRPNPWRTLRSKRGLRNVLATGAAASASATLGALATDPDSEWYARIEKPSWQPPPVAFPLVWTPLYADIAATSAAALPGVAGLEIPFYATGGMHKYDGGWFLRQVRHLADQQG